MSEQMDYRHSEPYPVPRNLQRNTYYAKILLESFSGRSSEMTAATQYILHHLEAETENAHIAGCLRGIAIVEMHHLDLLGGCIRQLGVAPRYRTIHRGRALYWDARYVDCRGGMKDMLETDLRGEHMAIEEYRRVVECIREPGICDLIRRIIRDEELHIEILQALLQEVCGEKT